MDDRSKLRSELTLVLNDWMRRPECVTEPETALGAALGALAEALGDLTATFRFANNLSDEWSETCIRAGSQVFANEHMAHLIELRSKLNAESADGVELN